MRRFWFRLAAHLGCTVSELQRRMSSREFSEWVAFYGLEPFGFQAEFMGHAQTAATIVNVNRGKGKPVKVQDFMPKEPEQQQQTPEQMIQFAAMFTAAAGGTVSLPQMEGGDE